MSMKQMARINKHRQGRTVVEIGNTSRKGPGRNNGRTLASAMRQSLDLGLHKQEPLKP